jgi:hypothetical protein
VTGGRAQIHPVGELADTSADREQPQSHRLQEQPHRAGGHKPAAQRVEHPGVGAMEQQAHLVSQEDECCSAVGFTASESAWAAQRQCIETPPEFLAQKASSAHSFV